MSEDQTPRWLVPVCALVVLVALCVACWQSLEHFSDQSPSPSQELVNQNNLYLIGIALHDYEAEHQRFPPMAHTSASAKPLLSWRVLVLPYLGEEALFRAFKLEQPWDSPHNQRLLGSIPRAYRHPFAKTDRLELTFYRGFTGRGTMFEEGEQVKFSNITDGAAETILVVEAAQAVPWTKPDELLYEVHKPVPKVGGHSTRDFHGLFCDGKVRRIANDLDEQLLRRIIMRNDGQPVDVSLLKRSRPH